MIRINGIHLSTELKRLWSPARIIVVLAVTALLIASAFIADSTGVFDSEVGPFITFNYSTILSGIFDILVPLSALFLCAGMINFDVKNNWMRTILSRPMTRQDFLLTKIIAISVSIITVMIVAGLIPTIILDVATGADLGFNFYKVAMMLLMSTLQAVLYVVIAAWLSLFLPGFINVFVFALWMLADSILAPIVQNFLWDSRAAQIMQEFFFPDGFSEASTMLLSKELTFPTEDILWGFAALAGFLLIASFQINFIDIDKSSD